MYVKMDKANVNIQQKYQIFLLAYSVGFFRIQLLENQFILLSQIWLYKLHKCDTWRRSREVKICHNINKIGCYWHQYMWTWRVFIYIVSEVHGGSRTNFKSFSIFQTRIFKKDRVPLKNKVSHKNLK